MLSPAVRTAAQPQPTRQLSAAARWVLTRLLAILALAILGTALWPDGQTRPLSYCQPEPAPTAATYAF